MTNPTVSSEIRTILKKLVADRYFPVKETGNKMVLIEEALSKLEELMKNIAWVIYDISDTPHLVIGTSAVNTHDPKLCPECIEPGVLKALQKGDK